MIKRVLKGLYRKLPGIDISSLYTTVAESSGKIPRHVYQTWVSPVLPPLVARGIRRFRKMNPEYSFSFFDDHQVAAYMEANYAGHPILKIFKDVRMPAERADIWRYCILYRTGGVYCDIKSSLRVPIKTILPEDATELISFEKNTWKDFLDLTHYADPHVFLPFPPDSVRAGLEHPDHVVINWFLCFQEGSPILEEVINLIVRHSAFYRGRVFETPSVAGNHFTGPLALTQAVWSWMRKTGKRPGQCDMDFRGQGIWKLPGMEYGKSPHHTSLRNMALLDLDEHGGAS
jgi:Glycosyltransferase sugar-binding region containing DXD motif